MQKKKWLLRCLGGILIVLTVISIIPIVESETLKKPTPVFYWNGEPFRPVGFNYYPRTHPWAGLWTAFNATELRADFQLIRKIGGNCIRTFIQWSLIEPAPGIYNSTITDRIIQLFDIAGEENLAIQFAFFDWGLSGNWPADKVGNRFTNQTMIDYEIAQLQYLIPLLKDKKAAFMWDLMNEPGDQYLTPDQFHNWVPQLATAVRTLDAGHYLTVGGVQWQNWDPAGYADLLDAVCLHYYRNVDLILTNQCWISDFQDQLDMFRKSGKPVIVQEFGLSNANFSEALVADYLADIFTIADKNEVAGLMPWCLWDYNRTRADLKEDQFGFLRYDTSWKPVAYVFQSYTNDTFTYTNIYTRRAWGNPF